MLLVIDIGNTNIVFEFTPAMTGLLHGESRPILKRQQMNTK